MLSWENDTLTFLPHDNNGQPEWKRKEKLYQQIIGYFDKGKCWEKGVPLCKELANFYETRLYDYNKLSDVLTTEAKFFQNILTQIRPEPEYFRVGFFGKGFPLFVRVSLMKVKIYFMTLINFPLVEQTICVPRARIRTHRCIHPTTSNRVFVSSTVYEKFPTRRFDHELQRAILSNQHRSADQRQKSLEERHECCAG